MKSLSAARRDLARENAKQTDALSEVPREQWPLASPPARLAKVWRSKGFLVQEFHERGEVIRLTVCRAMVDRGGSWTADIPWEALQRLKAECGYGARDAVEVYPPDRDVVNVSNMRHLWVLPERLPFVWRA